MIQVDQRSGTVRQNLIGDSTDDFTFLVMKIGPFALQVAFKHGFPTPVRRHQQRLRSPQPIGPRNGVGLLVGRTPIVTVDLGKIFDLKAGSRIRRRIIVIHQADRHPADRRLSQHLRLAAAAVVLSDLLRNQSVGDERQPQNQQK